MAKFTDYTEKTEPVDTDLALIYDTPAKVNKKFTFGNLWKWIAKKIVSEGISQLETTNKTIPGAINELNSKMFSGNSVNAIDANDMITSGWYRCSNISNVPSAKFGYLLVFSLYQDSRYIFQLFQDANSSSLFRRVCVNSEWKDWIHM